MSEKKRLYVKDEEISNLQKTGEKEKRMTNLIIYKIDENEQNIRELKIQIIQLILDHCKVNISSYIDKVFRIGKPNPTKTRPKLLSLISYDKKWKYYGIRNRIILKLNCLKIFLLKFCNQGKN